MANPPGESDRHAAVTAAKWRVKDTALLPLLAKCIVVASLFAPVVFGILYPARKSEADAYADAPMCAPHVADTSTCRLLTRAGYVGADCHNDAFPSADDFCEAQLIVDDTTRYIAVDRRYLATLAAAGQVHVEVFGSTTAQIEIDGRWMRERGSPEEAIRMLKVMLAVWTPLGCSAALYLCLRQSRGRSNSSPTRGGAPNS